MLRKYLALLKQIQNDRPEQRFYGLQKLMMTIRQEVADRSISKYERQMLLRYSFGSAIAIVSMQTKNVSKEVMQVSEKLKTEQNKSHEIIAGRYRRV